MRELRCSGNKLHAIVIEDQSEPSGVIEISCDSRFCGKKAGVVILHRFNLSTGSFTTERYSEPTYRKENNASRR